MSLIDHRILKENIFKGFFYLSTIGGDLLLQSWINAEFTVHRNETDVRITPSITE